MLRLDGRMIARRLQFGWAWCSAEYMARAPAARETGQLRTVCGSAGFDKMENSQWIDPRDASGKLQENNELMNTNGFH